MSDVFIIEELPYVDRDYVLRGYCPWCVERFVDRTLMGGDGYECPCCGDVFKDTP